MMKFGVTMRMQTPAVMVISLTEKIMATLRVSAHREVTMVRDVHLVHVLIQMQVKQADA
jgi:hypothetical protein